MSNSADSVYPANPWCGLWLSRTPGVEGWNLSHVVADGNDLSLDERAVSKHDPRTAPATDSGSASVSGDAGDSGMLTGTATGPEIQTHYPFTNLVASWNAATPGGSWVEVFVRAKIGARWSGWFAMGRWGGIGQGSSVEGQKSEDGEVEVDTLMLRTPASACQMRVAFTGAAAALPRLSLASLCWYNPAAIMPAAPAVRGDWKRTLVTPHFSQRLQDKRIAGEICSPTSLAMLLGFCGVERTPMEVASGVHDVATDMYGNWPMNTAYAGACGCTAYVARFWSIEQLQNEIARGRPVEASIRFGRGELADAPIHYSDGHLVLVVGFTPEGDVVVNDPAAPDVESVQRVYKRQQFRNAWIGGSGGIVYLVEPR